MASVAEGDRCSMLNPSQGSRGRLSTQPAATDCLTGQHGCTPLEGSQGRGGRKGESQASRGCADLGKINLKYAEAAVTLFGGGAYQQDLATPYSIMEFPLSASV
jgi:hypothetical protein